MKNKIKKVTISPANEWVKIIITPNNNIPIKKEIVLSADCLFDLESKYGVHAGEIK